MKRLPGNAIRVVKQALADGSLPFAVGNIVTNHDLERVEQILDQSLPEFRRQKQGARKIFAARALQAALRDAPEPDTDELADDSMHMTITQDTIMEKRKVQMSSSVPPSPSNADMKNSNTMIMYSRKNKREDGVDYQEPPPSSPAAATAATANTPLSSSAKKQRRPSSHPQNTMADMYMMANANATSFRKPRPSLRFADVGGVESVLDSIRELVEWPLKQVDVFISLGVDPPRGVLLHGPAGCGKTLIAQSIAGELDVSYFQVAAPEIVSGMSGESERKLRDLFEEAKVSAPSLIFIDEIDAISARRDNANKDMERRIVAQLLSCLDSISLDQTFGKPVMILAATNRPDSLDPALRRAGRFDRELEIGVPDEAARQHILSILTNRLKLQDSLDIKSLAKRTAGYVGADLSALATQAAMCAVRRVMNSKRSESNGTENNDRMELEDPALCISMQDFEQALDKVQPSALREGFTTVPDVGWDDVGALEEVRDELMMAIVEPIRIPEMFSKLGLSVPAGVLLYGPPGCGKTLLAKAVARESSANFISVKGPELLNKFVGESERAVRRLFQRARSSAPCVIFFDELDALAPKRGAPAGGSGESSSSGASERVVNQLLTELDGMDTRRQVFVIAATNRPDIIDPAMLRPGRLDRLLYVPLPDVKARISILSKCAKKSPFDKSVSLESVAMDLRCEGFSGADLSALVREAAVDVLREQRLQWGMNGNSMPDNLSIGLKNVNAAFQRVFPSVSPRDAKLYRDLQFKLRRSRAHLEKDANEEEERTKVGECK